jgi:hypothetical protein
MKKYLYKCDLRFHVGEDLDYGIWVTPPRSFLGGYQCFGGNFCLNFRSTCLKKDHHIPQNACTIYEAAHCDHSEDHSLCIICVLKQNVQGNTNTLS